MSSYLSNPNPPPRDRSRLVTGARRNNSLTSLPPDNNTSAQCRQLAAKTALATPSPTSGKKYHNQTTQNLWNTDSFQLALVCTSSSSRCTESYMLPRLRHRDDPMGSRHVKKGSDNVRAQASIAKGCNAGEKINVRRTQWVILPSSPPTR